MQHYIEVTARGKIERLGPSSLHPAYNRVTVMVRRGAAEVVRLHMLFPRDANLKEGQEAKVTGTLFTDANMGFVTVVDQRGEEVGT